MIVELTGAGKRFTKYQDVPMLATAALRLRQRTRRSSLWAIRGVDLSVERGECLGVIGRNGSGKSTLLSMLAGVTAPTEGQVVVRGRVAPLISVGVGFHPELTGRENVYVNGMILGMSRRQVDGALDQIVDFAEVEAFIDTPVKFYSSGMFVRLGFAVAVQADPDLLLVDEVLAVGDLAFQVKCYRRMTSIRESGSTIVVVSHNLNAIERLCPRTLVVDGGTVTFDGDTSGAISAYQEILGQAALGGLEGVQGEGLAPALPGAATVEATELVDAGGSPVRHLRTGDDAVLRMQVSIHEDICRPVLGVGITGEAGVLAYGDHAPLEEPLRKGERVTLEVSFRAALLTGSYTAALGLDDGERGRAATSAPVNFYVTGPAAALGVADLGGRFRRSP
ncbi:MAG TPA: ABC transporter ATP-binding protein [Acidimicrobiales bacterium]|nr:ABC transporter ATP-binding protein [Acidimicrobiales bacterium]